MGPKPITSSRMSYQPGINAMSIFNQYPQLCTLRKLVSDEIIEEEIGRNLENFEIWYDNAKQLIPTVNLNHVFPDELEQGSIFLENFLGHWGNVSIEELCKICLIVKWLKPRRILELGTYNGMTTLQMALNAPSDCLTYTIDLAPDQASVIPLGKIDELVAKHFKDKFATSTGSYFSNRDNLRIKQLWGDTATYDFTSIENPIDLIFIDAAHDYQNKKRDCETAFKLLSDRGVILWHDYGQITNPEVTLCISEFASQHKIYHLRNTNLAVFFAGNKRK